MNVLKPFKFKNRSFPLEAAYRSIQEAIELNMRGRDVKTELNFIKICIEFTRDQLENTPLPPIKWPKDTTPDDQQPD